jgi:hypothetical protein
LKPKTTYHFFGEEVKYFNVQVKIFLNPPNPLLSKTAEEGLSRTPVRFGGSEEAINAR